MASKGATKRLTKEYKSMVENPPPYIEAHPSERNILEWHYLITGPPDTPYSGGQYHGMLIFPKDYPFKPPEIRMITPNGRFQVNTRLCLSMSDFHPDTWQPAWSVATILTGLLSFMTGDEPTTGSIVTSADAKKRYAQVSLNWNATQNDRFKKEFPEMVIKNLAKVKELNDANEQKKRAAELEAAAKASAATSSLSATGSDGQMGGDADTGLSQEELAKMDPEDRIRYLAAQKPKKINSGRNHAMVYYVLAIAIVLGFFRVVS
ncbi:unnamed protein product [Cyberlindnera jadinii]|uniref:Ubiquitin-conjugating enzyme E2 6 n=1 Tax=Cyberlindnera jadinii (strain ATCC 18201 / CBS 1600 / BCRC 20928 / JCM 3617 / NBRC 0987 / NRRL Y-1542) TaxID=983966 RepID=A0A0H5C0T1_CYBJN|nr:UBC-like protein [Cyberlindnera jadinii NRRL Y-1542]ODV74941.1 UBC-like protein [Cyberlindnera jadinii NRRL Y-1542]CEP21400.1 unnamed protein product [Cyberlindnera jadinii]